MAYKYFVKFPDNSDGKYAGGLLENVLKDRGYIRGTENTADVFFYYSKNKEVTGTLSDNRYHFCIDDKTGEVFVVQKDKSKLGMLFTKNEVPRMTISGLFAEEEYKKITTALMDLILGRNSIVVLPDIIPTKSLEDIVSVYRLRGVMSGTWEDGKAQLQRIMSAYSLDMSDVDTLVREVGNTFGYESKIISILNRTKMFYKNGNDLIFPNVSSSIIVNMFDAVYALQRNNAVNRKKKGWEEKKKRAVRAHDKALNSAAKTILNSLYSKNSWKIYSKNSQRVNGIYTLYIPDNSMATGEIMIPRPSKGMNTDLDNYPKIGDYCINMRHPVTTVFAKVKVVGYTDDGSIRCNSLTALCFYGDADGDAQIAAWSPWMDKLIIGDACTIEEFCMVAGIRIDENDVFDNKFSLDEFLLDPPSEEEALIGSCDSGLLQANAKLITNRITGLFGVVERDIAQTLIVNRIDYTSKMLYETSWVSQVPVQAKNILEDIREDNLSQQVKETCMLVFLMSKDLQDAAKKLAPLFGKSVLESQEILGKFLTEGKASLLKQIIVDAVDHEYDKQIAEEEAEIYSHF